MVASAGASLVSRVCCHPIDTLKARLQAEGSRRWFGGSAWQIVKKTWQREGVIGFYRGFGAVAAIGTPAGCLYLTTYESVRDAVGDDSVVTHFGAGLIAEAVACLLFVPVDVLKERAQVRSASSFRLAVDIIRDQGIAGLYRGYGATMISFGVYSGLYFVLYESAKRRLLLYFHNSKNNSIFGTALLASLFAGGLASWCTNPLDLTKLRIQVADDSNLGFFSLLRTVHKTEGLSGLFRGAGARVAFFAPSTAIAMASFESFKLALSSPPSSSSPLSTSTEEVSSR